MSAHDELVERVNALVCHHDKAEGAPACGACQRWTPRYIAALTDAGYVVFKDTPEVLGFAQDVEALLGRVHSSKVDFAHDAQLVLIQAQEVIAALRGGESNG